MNHGKSGLLVALGVVGALGGCSTARDVEVSGEVTAPSSLAVGDELVIELVDVVGVGKDAERSVVHRGALRGLGEFEASVQLEGNQVLVRVIDDRDGDGGCSLGEAWEETYAPVEADEVTFSLLLGTSACPGR